MGSHSSAMGDESRGGVPDKFDIFRTYLFEQDDWYRDLVDHSRDLLCVHDLEGRLLACNPAPARVLGYSIDELLKIPMRELVFPECRDQFDAYLRQMAETGEARGVMAVLARNGERRLWEYHNTLRTEGVPVPVVRGIAHDVTEQMRAAKQLREANQRLVEEARQREQVSSELRLFRALVDQCSDVVLLVDMETLNLLDVNGSASTALGYSREELLIMNVRVIAPSITPELHAQVKQQLRSKGSAMIERDHYRKDGSAFPVEVHLKLVTSDREYVVAIARDITERKRVESALRASENHFRMLIEQASDGIFLNDASGKYIDVNCAGAEVLGYSREEILEKSVEDVLVADEHTRLYAELSRMRIGETSRGEWQFVRKDGSIFPGEVTARQLPDGRLQAFLRDISHRKRNELALREAMEELRKAKEKLAEERLYLEEEIDAQMGFGEIVGQSKPLKQVLAQVATVAASDATVLVEGETGTGKELIARAIHRMSPRRGGSFIKMNCAAIPSGLMESELFGHEKGAFTGAVDRKVGRLELADRGTLFLDEIGEIPISMQPKLLRVLQDQEFERLGGTRTLRVDFRLVVATNRDLWESVKQGQFRGDLYYRLKVFPLIVPPLRERSEDIPALVEHFVRIYAARMKKSITSIPKRTMEVLERWDWPGNIRELENFIERSVILTEGSALRAPLRELSQPSITTTNLTLEEAQKEHILRVLRESGGQLGGPTGAAARLGLKRTTLQSKLKQLGIGYKRER